MALLILGQHTCRSIATRRARKPQSPSPRPAKHDESWLSVCNQLLEHGNEVKFRPAHEHISCCTCVAAETQYHIYGFAWQQSSSTQTWMQKLTELKANQHACSLQVASPLMLRYCVKGLLPFVSLFSCSCLGLPWCFFSRSAMGAL